MIENKFDDIQLDNIDDNDEVKRSLQIIELAKKHKAITINIADFTFLIKETYVMSKEDNSKPILDLITDREILQTGFYGRVKGMEIYVNRMVAPDSYVIGRKPYVKQ